MSTELYHRWRVIVLKMYPLNASNGCNNLCNVSEDVHKKADNAKGSDTAYSGVQLIYWCLKNEMFVISHVRHGGLENHKGSVLSQCSNCKKIIPPLG